MPNFISPQCIFDERCICFECVDLPIPLTNVFLNADFVVVVPTGISTDESLSTSVTNQPVHQKENTASLLVTSNSDQFLTTPDGEEKDISQDSSELKHRSSKKDLLEIDRFTICGNRID